MTTIEERAAEIMGGLYRYADGSYYDDHVKALARRVDELEARLEAADRMADALAVFADCSDKRRRDDIWGAVCFQQPKLLRARETLAAYREASK